MKFDNGEIIIRDDLAYPDGALIVDGFDASGSLLAHPMGGGLQLTIPSSDIPRFTVVTELERTPIFHRGRFEIEGVDEGFAGWSDGRAWNGWAMPYFEFDEAENVIAAVSPDSARYHEDLDAFVAKNQDDEDETWASETIALPDGGQVKVYPIGAGSWIWDEAEEGDEQ